ncbi:hypothetical protein KR067_004272 [Drosophila pandora]|nr:hypothetical protein KR067_004272 [Drosophila pandora]
MFCGNSGFGMILVLVGAMAFTSDLSLVSGQTVAPLVTSTVKPTSAPKMEGTPTKAMIINAPPSKQKKEPLVKAKDGAKPLQVTGFITKSGNIYEIEDKRGMGAIEGRQAVEEKQADQIVCNYGNVVIYSDVPCDQVTNVRVGEIKQIKDGKVESPESSTTEKNQAEEDKEQDEMQEQDQQNEDENQEEQVQQTNHPRQQPQNQNRRRRRRPGQKQQQQQRLQQQRRRQQQQQRRRRVNGNGNGGVVVRRRRNRNNNNKNNNSNGGQRRGQQQQRRRRPNNNNRRRNGNNNNNRRRNRPEHRRRIINVNRQGQQRRGTRQGSN